MFWVLLPAVPLPFNQFIHKMFRFAYMDTLKVLEKWGPGCYFYADGDENSLAELENMLASERKNHPADRPVLALFTEIPSNPLLRSINLRRLRELADDYDFLVIVDDTVGNFVNVNILPFVDILVSSLSKVFSGEANVLGGRYAPRYIT